MSGSPGEEVLAKAFTNTPKVKWAGTWSEVPPNALDPNVLFVPQFYHKDSDDQGYFSSNAAKALAKGERHLLGLGEANTPGPFQVNAEQAVQIYADKLMPFRAKNHLIGAPTFLQNPQDFDFLDQFLDKCTAATKCQVDFICLHWMAGGTDQSANFQQTVLKAIAHSKGLPVWVDNIQALSPNAGGSDPTAQMAFLKQIIPFLENNPNIERYAYVGMNDKDQSVDLFATQNGGLTDLGKFYANA